MTMTRKCVWDSIIGQNPARDFLKAAVQSHTISHGYLFVGPAGTGKKTAARALACAAVCDDDGCGICRACSRIMRDSHPDVQVLAPQGAASYLLDEQIRPLIRDIHLKPLEARHKFYILDQADLMGDATANAFLKTLEEPPPGVTIILLASSYESVPPTIASRCLVVRFRQVPPSSAQAVLEQRTGASPQEAIAALAATGGVISRAVDFLESSSRREARARILSILKDLPAYDEFDVLRACRELLVLVNAPLEETKAAHAKEIRIAEETLGKSGGKALQVRHKRELTAREREGVVEILSITESWLRDCLVLSLGLDELVLNTDVLDAMQEVAAVITPQAANRGLGAVREARQRISYNVNVQLAIEAMLFDVREVLVCPRQ